MCVRISQEDLAEGHLSCISCVAWLSGCAVLKEVVAPSAMGTDGCRGAQGDCQSWQPLETARRSRTQAAPSRFGVGTQGPHVGGEQNRRTHL